jgi:16S rRNA (guanine1207-N2)-methyltransferase
LTEHYFTPEPRAPHEVREFAAVLRGHRLLFQTDANVFSRDRVDPGTSLLIKAMQVPAAGNVLDLGCGYGPVGIAAAKVAPGASIYMVEINERAAALARANVARNEVGNAEVRVGDGLAAVAGIAFDVVLTNPPIRAGKQVIYAMVDGARAALREGGTLWVVIQTKQGAPSMKKKLAETFGNVEDVERQSGYHVFVARK